MRRRLGLGAKIAIMVVLTTVGASVALAATVYALQAGSARGRFVTSATLGFRSDVQQAAEHQVACPGGRTNCSVASAAAYMHGRLGLTWALVDLTPGASLDRDGRYIPVDGNTGWQADQLPIGEIDEANNATSGPKPSISPNWWWTRPEWFRRTPRSRSVPSGTPRFRVTLAACTPSSATCSAMPSTMEPHR